MDFILMNVLFLSFSTTKVFYLFHGNVSLRKTEVFRGVNVKTFIDASCKRARGSAKLQALMHRGAGVIQMLIKTCKGRNLSFFLLFHKQQRFPQRKHQKFAFLYLYFFVG